MLKLIIYNDALFCILVKKLTHTIFLIVFKNVFIMIKTYKFYNENSLKSIYVQLNGLIFNKLQFVQIFF